MSLRNVKEYGRIAVDNVADLVKAITQFDATMLDLET